MLPMFTYHPDPMATGSVVAAPADRCVRCGRHRGHLYVGPVYAVDELAEQICPWCIADGTAARRYDAQFTDIADAPETVPAEVLSEIAERTPGFDGWQQEQWLYHCDDGAAFLGRAGAGDLAAYPDAVETLRHEPDGPGWPYGQVDEYLASLDKDGPPTAYLFRCRHCARHLAYSDFT